MKKETQHWLLVIPICLSCSGIYAEYIDVLDNKKKVEISNKVEKNVKINIKLPVEPEAITFVKKVKAKKKKVKKRKYGLSGIFLAKKSLGSSDKSLNAGITWKPDAANYHFLKVGMKKDISDDEDTISYSWGLGYDDWHEGTWAFQINHWGGIRSGDGFDSYNSIASLSYKVDSDFLRKYKLKSGLSLAKQLGGDSDFKVSASLGWSPKQYWFIRAILVKKINDDDPTWNYVMGYDDWHPGTFGIEYSNYNANPLYETNFMESGNLAITYKWKY